MAASRTAAPPRTPFGRMQSAIRWSRLGRGDRIALGLLIALPILSYLPLALAGFPVMPGDDLVQNYPLRVLAGAVIRSGRLPAWDPAIWSGTPLLGSWNAGAMFPGTWLFAFLPGIAAWTLNVIGVPLVAGIGAYAFLRRLACRPVPAFLGALVFADTGYMSGQIVHIGLTWGNAFVPWMLLAIEQLARTKTRRAAIAPVAGLALAFGLCILAGDPRAATTAAIVVVVYALACALRRGVRVGTTLGWTAEAVVVGIALAAIQWLPGLTFLQASQRNATVYNFFGAGSLTVPHIASQLTIPFLLGGNGNFGLPIYAGSFNLPEVTIGCGIVALVAAGLYLPICYRRYLAWASDRQRGVTPSAVGRPLGVWFVLLLLGLLLTLGANTALGHLLVHIPLYGHERLQNRNAALIDLGLAVLVAYLIDDLTPRRATAEDGPPVDAPLSSRVGRVLALVPVVLSLVLGIAAYVDPAWLERVAHLPAFTAHFFVRVAPLVIVPMAIAAAAGLLLLLARRLRPAIAYRGFLVLVICDIAMFVATASYTTAPASVLENPNLLATELGHLAGPNGRVAIYNPYFAFPAGDPQVFAKVGVTDLNILRDQRSVQGYGSIVQGTYQDVTNTHAFQNLNPDRLPGETYNTLDLRALLVLPDYLQIAIPVGAPIPLAGGGSTGPPGARVPPVAVNPSGPWTVEPGETATWLLAAPTSLQRVTVALRPESSGRDGTLRLGVGSDAGSTRTATVPVHAGEAYWRLPRGTRASALTVSNTGDLPVVVGAVVAVTEHPALRLLLDGTLQGLLPYPHWQYSGLVGPFSAFTNSETRGLAWLQPTNAPTPDTSNLAPGSVRVEVTGNDPSTSEQLVVRAPEKALLVRSETYSPGWTARLTPVGGGPTRVLTAYPFGLVQKIYLPAGNYIVTWRYAPVDLLGGLVGSGFGIIALGAYAIAAARARRQVEAETS